MSGDYGIQCIPSSDGSDVNKPRSRFHAEEMVTIPAMVVSYNKSMGGVDHLDQLRLYYPVGRIERKWWKYLFWGLLNIAMINAYNLWTLSQFPLPRNRRRWPLKEFKLKTIHQLCAGFSSRTSRAAFAEREVLRVVEPDLTPGHSIVQFQGRKKRCQSCLIAGRRTSTSRAVESSFFACKYYSPFES